LVLSFFSLILHLCRKPAWPWTTGHHQICLHAGSASDGLSGLRELVVAQLATAGGGAAAVPPSVRAYRLHASRTVNTLLAPPLNFQVPAEREDPTPPFPRLPAHLGAHYLHLLPAHTGAGCHGRLALGRHRRARCPLGTRRATTPSAARAARSGRSPFSNRIPTLGWASPSTR